MPSFSRLSLIPLAGALLVCPLLTASGQESADDEGYSYVGSDEQASDANAGKVLGKKTGPAAKAASAPAEAKAGVGVTISSSSKERTRQWMQEQKLKNKTVGTEPAAVPEPQHPILKRKPSPAKSAIAEPAGNTTDAPESFDSEFRETKRTPGGRKVIGLDTRGAKWEKTQKKEPVQVSTPQAAAQTPSEEAVADDDAPEPLVDATDEIMQTAPAAGAKKSSSGKAASSPGVKTTKAPQKGKKTKTSGPELLPLPDDPAEDAASSRKSVPRKAVAVEADTDSAASAETGDETADGNKTAAGETSSSEAVSLFDKKFDGEMPIASHRKMHKKSGK